MNFRSNTYNPREKSKLPIIGYILTLGAFTVFTCYLKYQEWSEKKSLANAEWNESSMRVIDYHDEETVRIAFRKFQESFASVNDFRLHGYYVDTKDTLINGHEEIFHTTYFYYYLRQNLKNEYKALIAVINKKAVIVFLNQSLAEPLPFSSPNSFTYYNKEGLDAWNNLPETTRLKLMDTLGKYLH